MEVRGPYTIAPLTSASVELIAAATLAGWWFMVSVTRHPADW